MAASRDPKEAKFTSISPTNEKIERTRRLLLPVTARKTSTIAKKKRNSKTLEEVDISVTVRCARRSREPVYKRNTLPIAEMSAPKGEKSSKKMPNEKFSTTTRDEIEIADENSRFTRSRRTLELLRGLEKTKLVTAGKRATRPQNVGYGNSEKLCA